LEMKTIAFLLVVITLANATRIKSSF